MNIHNLFGRRGAYGWRRETPSAVTNWKAGDDGALTLAYTRIEGRLIEHEVLAQTGEAVA